MNLQQNSKSSISGNIISFMVYLAPLLTFYRVYKLGSTEGFQSVPYVVALFSAMLWTYYAIEKTDSTLLITINSFGCLIEDNLHFHLPHICSQVCKGLHCPIHLPVECGFIRLNHSINTTCFSWP